MRILIFALLNILISFPSMAYQSILPESEGKLIKKMVQHDGVEHHYFMYRSDESGINDLFIVFHGGRVGAEEFLKGTAFHNKITNNGHSLVVFESYMDPNWYENESFNFGFVNKVLGSVYNNGYYDRIYMVGYTEGGTFMSDLFCMGRFGANELWNINGTIKKSCNITNNVSYNLIIGETMLLMDYDEEYYKNYGDLRDYFLNRVGNCKRYPERVVFGNKFKERYVTVDGKQCLSSNNYSIYTMKGVGRNFPASIINNDDLIGDTVNYIDMYNWIKKY